MSDESLGGYIASQRWSGARGEALRGVRVEAEVPVGETGSACVVVHAEVDGRPVHYQLWPRGAQYDALGDADVRAGLARLLASGATVRGTDAALVAEPEAGVDVLHGGAESSRALGTEQSNTSIVYGDRAIVKLFRRLTPGVHPDVEIVRFLTRRGFAHTPPLLATLTVHDARGASLAAMAQAFVPGAGDAWGQVVQHARAAASDGRDEAGADEARRVGEVTRALHDALASDPSDPDFAPRPADGATAARWAASAARSVERGLWLLRERLASGALERLGQHARAQGAAVGALDAASVVAALDAAAARAADDAGAATRHHGDYHLGQILRAPDGTLYVIDFEGEPSRPLDERRARHSPLRDVAGMLRSFAYAAATAAFERPGDAVVAGHAARWEATSRAAFLDGYFGDTPATYLPRVRTNADALVGLFELEKAFYELAYELRNRPTWVPIPLAGIARLTASPDARVA